MNEMTLIEAMAILAMIASKVINRAQKDREGLT